MRLGTIGRVRKWLAIAIAVGLGATACTSGDEPPPIQVPSDFPTVEGKGPKNPFGVLNAVPGLDVGQQVTIAKELGVRYVRPAFPIFAQSSDLACVGCEEFAEAGLDLIITVRNSEDVASLVGTGQRFPPASPPADLSAYKQTIATIVERYQPVLLVVENEEDVLNHYSGTPEDYGEQLRAACEAAHDSGVKCTNGGLLSGSVVDLVYQNYVDLGMDAEAQSFGDRAFEDFQTARRSRPGGDPRLEIVIDRGRRLLEAYRGSGADYVNFHWYVADPQAMEEAAAYVSEATGLPPMTNEIGQRDLSPDTTVQMMAQVLRLGLPYAVWYLADARLAKGLIDRNGSLRPTGEAFREFIRTNS
jgi:hypothetical protein